MYKPKESEEGLERLIWNKAPLSKIKQAVNQSGVYYVGQDNQSRPALHLATMLGQDKVVTLLLDSGANINEFDNNLTALQLSICYVVGSCFRILVHRNADVNLAQPNTELPIFLIIQTHIERSCNGYTIGELNGMMRLLLEAGANVNATSCEYDTVLIRAVDSVEITSHISLFNTIMKFKPNLNQCSKSGASPLHIAVGCRDDWLLAMVKALVQGGADVNARDIDGNSVLHYLFIHDGLSSSLVDEHSRLAQQVQLVKLLSTNGADVNARNKYQITPLFMVVECLSYEGVEEEINIMHRKVNALIDAGAWLNVCSLDISRLVSVDEYFGRQTDSTPGHTMLNYARDIIVKYRKPYSTINLFSEFKWLLDHNIDVDMCSKKEQGLLHRVVQVCYGTGAADGVYDSDIHYDTESQ